MGRVGLGYFLDARGRVVTEMSLARLGEDEFWLITAASAQAHDRELLEKTMPERVVLEDETDLWATQILTGPQAREILGRVAEADLSLPWLSWQEAQIAGAEVVLMRVSFAGELGWEIHSRRGDTAKVWDAVMAAGAPLGLKPFGMFALDALRVEKGYRAWKGDLSTDYSALESGLGRFIDWAKPDFPGKAALEAERQRGAAKRFCTLAIDSPEFDPPYMSTIWHGGEVVGETDQRGLGASGWRLHRAGDAAGPSSMWRGRRSKSRSSVCATRRWCRPRGRCGTARTNGCAGEGARGFCTPGPPQDISGKMKELD